jgi:FtsH-binding integral membrane protein
MASGKVLKYVTMGIISATMVATSFATSNLDILAHSPLTWGVIFAPLHVVILSLLARRLAMMGIPFQEMVVRRHVL